MRKTKENVSLLLKGVGALVTKDIEKAELLNAFLALVFTAKACPQESQNLDTREEFWRKEDLPLIEENQDRDHLCKHDTYRFIDPNRMHPGVLRELSDVTSRPLHHL